MRRLYHRPLFLGLALVLLGNSAAFGQSPAPGAAAGSLQGARLGETKAKVGAGDRKHWSEQYARLPLGFETNLGQTDARVKFLSRGRGYTLFLTDKDAVLTLHGSKAGARLPSAAGSQSSGTPGPAERTTSVLRMQFADANPYVSAAGADQLPGKINYFIGSNPKNWHTNIPTYSRVDYRGVYPGVDLTYYGDQGQLEYDFAVAPGADPGRIRLQLQGADKVRVSPSGDLILSTRAGEVRLRKPDVYQIDPATLHQPNESAAAGPDRHAIRGRYVVRHSNEIGFEVGVYDPKQTLIIDPVLVYSTYLGGSNDEKLSGIGVTLGGEMVAAGDTASVDYPTQSPYQSALGGPRNVFVTELSADGSSLVFSTYLGGNASDGGWGVAIDSSGNIYVDGFTSSSNFPVTSNAYNGTFVSGSDGYDVFLSKFDSTGSNLLYSTFIGQMDYTTLVDGQVGLAANNSGLAYVCSTTNDSNYPTTTGAYQTTLTGTDDGVLSVLDTTKSGTSSLVYSTFLGGSTPPNAITTILNIALDSSGNVYGTGYTKSTNFPTTSGAFQTGCPQTGTCTANAFVSKINPAGQGFSDLVFSSYFGGTDTNVTHGLGIAVDSSDDAYITGFTQAAGLPTTPGAFQGTCSKCGGSADLYEGFVAAFNPTGTGLIYATYLGGESYDEPKVIAVDSLNDAYVVGRTSSTQFPVLNPLQATKAGPTATSSCQSGDCSAFDGFITELNPTGTALVFSTFNGGSNFDSWNADVVDSSGNLYVGGRTESLDYAATAGAFQPAHAAIAAGSAGLDATMAKISPTGSAGVGLGPASVPACTANVNPPCFASQVEGTTISPQPITLTAAGAPLTISNISVSGPFQQTSPACLTTLASGAQCTIYVTFAPAATGAQTGTLTITDNGAPSTGCAGCQNVPLTGSGSAASGAAVSFSPTVLSFGSETPGTPSAAQPVTLTNTSTTTALSITNIGIAGTDSSDFAQTNTCGASVAAGGNCTINVTFTPTATGTRTASISVADGATGSPQTAALTGIGSFVQLNMSSLTFASQDVGTPSPSQTVTLTNASTTALTVTAVSVIGLDSGDFAQTNTCTSVAAGSNCTISVTFTPTAAGTRTAVVSIADSDGSSPQTIPLTGTGNGSAATLTPTSLTFASQVVSTSSTSQPVTLTNGGTAALSITSISITGTNPGDFTQTNNCGTSVAAGANCTINVTFTPTATGTRTASVSIADNATGSPQTVALTGTGATASAVTLSPTSLTFASQGVGTTSPVQSVTLNNTGGSALSITSISITGTNPGDFGQTNTCGTSVAAGANCTISVTFTPTATGTRTASISIADNVTGSPQTVSLTGTGAAAGNPAASLSPTSLTFPLQVVGQSGVAQVVTLTNTGTGALSITSISVTGTYSRDYTQTNTCGTSVAAGANCTISVTFKPHQSTPPVSTATLSIADNATGSPQSVALSGTGTFAQLAPTSLTFSSQSVGTPSPAQTITLTNTLPGNPITVTSITITGTDSTEFAQTNTCTSASVPSGGTCSISVTFTPAASGTRTATVSVSDNGAGGSPQTVPLTGTGAGPAATLAPTSLTFASQAVSTSSVSQAVTLTNGGTAALGITSVSITGTNAGDFTQTNTCGTSVAAGANCTINVTFTPTATGTRTASVSVTDNAAGSPQTVTLTGTATAALAPAVTLAPTSLAFTGLAVGTPTAAQTVTLTNSGGAALSITSVSITGANPGDFAQTNNCGTSVAAAAGCTITVTFTPAALGTRTASVSIADNAAGSPQTVGLTGTTGPVASLSPSTGLTFPQTNVGTTSAAQTVTLTNTGNSTLTPITVALTGTNSGDFTYTSTCGSNSLQPGASCTLTVTFKPTATGTRSASITFTDNAPGSPQSVTLSGTGITTPGASLSPASLAFSTTQLVGTTSPVQTVTLTNTGSASLSSISISATSGFSETNNCGTSLAVGASCTISAYFKPTAAGAVTGSLSVADNAPDTPQVAALTGTGVASGVGFQPTSLVFKGQALNTPSSPQTVTLTNTGTAALSISSFAFTGTDSADFSQTNNCPSSSATLSAGATCTISVVFKPATSGNFSAALSVTDNAPGSPHSLPVSGAGSGFELTAPTSTVSVAAGQPASYALSFAPTGGFNGMVTLSCTTTAPAASCSVAPATLTLNAPNTATATATVTTTANGAAPPRQQLPSGPGPWLWWVLAGVTAAGFGLLGRSRKWTGWALAGALVLVLAWAGCGGGGSSTTPSGPTSTPAGTYQVTVTANATAASQNVSLTLTVQ